MLKKGDLDSLARGAGQERGGDVFERGGGTPMHTMGMNFPVSDFGKVYKDLFNWIEVSNVYQTCPFVKMVFYKGN